MAEMNVNHIAELALVLAGGAVSAIPRQQAQDGNGNGLKDVNGRPVLLVPTHALIYVKNQPIRWLATGAAVNSSDGEGQFVPAGAYIDWTNPLANYNGLIQKAQFTRDQTATGPATLEISLFN